jgi:hypothetical protein
MEVREMATHLLVHASGAMFKTFRPSGWTFCFGVYVCNDEGKPIEGLKRSNFSIWRLVDVVDQQTINMLVELNATFPTSDMPGIYRLQTKVALGAEAPHPQQFVFAIRAEYPRTKTPLQGFTTVAITYLGELQHGS